MSPLAQAPATAGIRVVKDLETIRSLVLASRAAGRRVGFVPTMGGLHAGHASLVAEASAMCDDVVVSIFVNPTQFCAGEDFARYPRTFEADLACLATQGVRWVFAPTAEVVYPPDHATRVVVRGPALPFEGESRPGHFEGVATVVCRLFLAVPADIAYFGAKDWQQTLVVRRLVADLGLPITITVCPTIRDADGLALSSRNSYLTADERVRAAAIPAALEAAESAWQKGTAIPHIEADLRTALERAGIVVDYGVIVDRETLEAPPTASAIALVAGRLGSTRLIDNRLLEPRSPAC
jgi:pantoate--beta-alanine ligase